MVKISSKPKVLILTSITGGLAHYTSHLQEFLRKYCKLYFVTYKKNYLSGEKIDRPGDNLIAKNIKLPYYLLEHDSPTSLFDLLHLIKKLKINVVNIQFTSTAMPVIFYYHVLCKKLRELRIPVILTCHDVLQHTHTRNELNSLNLIYNEADHFIVGNKIEYKKLMDNFVIQKNKATIIEHGVYDKFDNNLYTENSARKYLKLQNKRVILFFGFLRKYKGILTLIDSMKIIVKKEKNVILHIAASSDVEDLNILIRKRIKDNKLSKNIIFNNRYFPTHEIEAIYKASDIVALPYTNVSQSGVLSLSLYFKKPVIITDIFAESSLVNKKMGLVVKPNSPKELADAILYLLRNKYIAQKYGETGYKYIKKYRSWDKIAKQMYATFCKYLNKQVT